MEQELNIDQTINHLFRQESGKMVSVLVNIFGAKNYELAEDVVQDALVRALETWKFRGMPDNPKAWLYRTAKNKAIDIIRKNKHNNLIDFSEPDKQLLTSGYSVSTTMDSYWQESHIRDDFLGMMYACCHPEISQENQVTFILKSLCGFSTKEVAKSFLTSEETISKRLYRTKEYFRKNNIRPKIPSEENIDSRTAAVLRSIYLLFNEGYNATHSEELIRKDLLSQALYLCKNLVDNKKIKSSEANALMALMCFHTARSEGRLTGDGAIVQLSKQDRSTWNAEIIQAGKKYLFQSGLDNTYSTYHLEAAIAMQHCEAKKYEDTNWKVILDCYDSLLQISKDPVVAVNRCLVVLELNGPEAAMKEISKLKSNKTLANYYLYYAVLGAIQARLQQREAAIKNYKLAITHTQSQQERDLLNHKISIIKKELES